MTQYTKVWQLLEDPERWTQGAEARDANGNLIGPHSPRACSWCLSGAIWKIYYKGDDYFSAVHRVHNRLHDVAIVAWNDKRERTHAEVLDLCKELYI